MFVLIQKVVPPFESEQTCGTKHRNWWRNSFRFCHLLWKLILLCVLFFYIPFIIL